MEFARRLSALIIALSLVLPQRSCVIGGEAEIYYPLSNLESSLAFIVIAALYSLPLIALILIRFRKTSLLLGLAAVGAGFYYVSYGASVLADKLLIGWYTYTFAAIVYAYASLILLKRVLSPDILPK